MQRLVDHSQSVDVVLLQIFQADVALSNGVLGCDMILPVGSPGRFGFFYKQNIQLMLPVTVNDCPSRKLFINDIANDVYFRLARVVYKHL
jgi:hypothetical protein